MVDQQEQALRLRALRDCDAIFTRVIPDHFASLLHGHSTHRSQQICQENGIGIELISLARAAEALEESVDNDHGAGHHVT